MEMLASTRAPSNVLQRENWRQVGPLHGGSHVCKAFGRGSAGSSTQGTASPAAGGVRLSTALHGQEPIRTVEPAPDPTGPPVPLLAAGCLGLVAAAAFLVKKLRDPSAESMYGIESTSYGDAGKKSRDIFSNVVMKNMNTTTMPELSEEMVAAARARRQKERANHKLSLEDVELPENHPWAVKAQVSPEEDEAVRARLRVRPRMRPAAAMQAEEGGSMKGSKRILRSRPTAPLSPAAPSLPADAPSL